MADTIEATTDTTADSTIDKLTGTSAEDRKAFIGDAQTTLSDAVASVISAVKDNPKTAAAIAAGATAAVAGAAYGATKLAQGATKPRATAKRAPAKRTPAKK